jgi:hypothetical protein
MTSQPVSERSRWPPLTRMLMSGEMSGEKPRDLSSREKFDRWMINEGYRRLCVKAVHFKKCGNANILSVSSSFSLLSI